MPMTRKSFTEEFKLEAVPLAEKSGNISQLARDLGIHGCLLRKWQEKIRGKPERPFPGKGMQKVRSCPGLKKKMPASKRRWKS